MNHDDKLEMFLDRWFIKIVVVGLALGAGVFIFCFIVILHFVKEAW